MGYEDTRLALEKIIGDREFKILLIDSAGNIVAVTTDGFLKVASLADKETEQKLSSYSLGAGATYNVDVTIPTGKTGVAVTLKAAYNASATDGVTLNVLYSPNGTDYDTDTDDSYTHPFTAGQTKQKTYVIAAIHPYVRLQMVNNDGSYGATVDMWVTYI